MLKDLAPAAPPFTAPSGLDKLCPSQCWRPSPSPWNSSGAGMSGPHKGVDLHLHLQHPWNILEGPLYPTYPQESPGISSISKHLPLPAVPPPWCWGFPRRTSPPSAPGPQAPRPRLQQMRRPPPRGSASRSNGSCHRPPDPRCGRLWAEAIKGLLDGMVFLRFSTQKWAGIIHCFTIVMVLGCYV